MSAAIGPGDWVECIDDSAGLWGDPLPLSRGAVYRVRRIINGETPEGDFLPGLALDGIEMRHPEAEDEDCFDPARFRPIYPGGGLIKKLLEKLPDQERIGEPA